MKRLLLGLLLVVGPAAPSPGLSDLAQDVTIYRDTYGIPHVFGKTDAATAFGFGYAQAEDNFPRIEDNYLRAIGRWSEFRGESGFDADRLNRTLEIPRLARAEYRRLSGPVRAIVDGYTAGINYWLARHPPSGARYLTRIEPWYPLAFIRYNYFQNGFLFSTGIRRSELKLAAVDRGIQENTGSNGWVINPEKSTTGHALLFINPHLPFFGPGQVYEGHVHSESGWDFTGYTRLGFPLPYVGHGPAVGWVSTDNAADQADAWLETFDDPANPRAYRWGKTHRLATEWSDTIRVKTDAGVDVRVVRLRRTHHGPIVGMRDGRPIAVRMARLEEDGWLGEWYAMTRARTIAELKQALAPRAMLFGNVMAADTAGTTFYIYNGAVPRRDPRFDWTRPVEGSDTATEWHGYHTLEELPQLTSPASGWMQNCNTSPFLLTDRGNPDSTRFPRYMVTEGDNPRGRVSRLLLAGRDKFSWEEWVKVGFDTRVIMADSLLPLLLADGDADALPDSLKRARSDARSILSRWNHRADTNSVATTIFTTWIAVYNDLENGHPGDPANRLMALDSTIARLSGAFGTWRVEWGTINRLQRVNDLGAELPFSDAGASLAVPGVSGNAGAVFTLYGRSPNDSRKQYGVAGGTYVSVVEFGPKVRAMAVHVFGESGDPRSPHYFDQAPLYASGTFRPVWLTLDEIRQHLERSYHPGG